MNHMPPKTNAARSQGELSDSLAAIVMEHVNAELQGAIQRVLSRLLDMTAAGLDAETVRQRIKAGTLLKTNAYAYFHLCTTGIDLAMRQAWQQMQAGAVRKPDNKLMGASGTDSAAMARPLDKACSDLLTTMQVRLAFVLGRGILQPAQNPFRPEVLLNALDQAWREFQPDSGAHKLLLPMLTPDTLFDLRPMYTAINEALKKRSTSRDGARKQDSAEARDGVAQSLREMFKEDTSLVSAEFDPPSGVWHTAGAAPLTAGGEIRAHEASASKRDWSQGSAEAYRSGINNEIIQRTAHGAPAQLMQLLATQPQTAPATNYLFELKSQVPSGSLSRVDERTIDLLAKVFDKVFIDQQIPPQVRELMQFLQIPVLKAALQDKEFFFQDAHPARRMIDLLSRMGWEQHQDAQDPVFSAMQRSVDRVGRDYQEEMSVFAEAVAELEQSIEQAEAKEETAIAEPVAVALKTEKQEIGKRQANDTVAVRLGSGDVNPMVESFLQERWIDVLTLAYTLEDDKPGALRHATATMDNLIWSVKPKLSQPQRKTLIGLLPNLLTALNKWLDLVGWRDEKRLQFFSQLAEIHASIVRAPVELSPEKQLELAAEAAQQDALKQQELERRAEELAQLRAEQEAVRAEDDVVQALASVERGRWLEFATPEGPRKVKLAWVSPLRTLFIFSNGAQQPAFTMNEAEFETAMRERRAKLLDVGGVVASTLNEVVNDPQMQVAA